MEFRFTSFSVTVNHVPLVTLAFLASAKKVKLPKLILFNLREQLKLRLALIIFEPKLWDPIDTERVYPLNASIEIAFNFGQYAFVSAANATPDLRYIILFIL